MQIDRFTLIVMVVFLCAAPAQSQNAEVIREALVASQSIISITDEGWSTASSTSDCFTGAGDDAWALTLTEPSEVTVTVTDCCCPGDYYEVYRDGSLIGTTPQLSGWGCSSSGGTSSGQFTEKLCAAGTYIYTVRDAGFDGHSQQEIADEQMCPAGFTVTGDVEPLTPPTTSATVAAEDEAGIPEGVESALSVAEQEALDLYEEIRPYLDERRNGSLRLLRREAMQNDVSVDALRMGQRLVALTNMVVNAGHQGLPAEGVDEAFAELSTLFLAISRQAPASSCGGFRNPSPCPGRAQSNLFFASEAEVMAHLIDLGYHQTATYAGGGSGRDYTLPLSHACGAGTFRTQAIVFQLQSGCWTYNTQSPEPNPDFRNYTARPFPGWVGYVAWWHFFFC